MTVRFYFDEHMPRPVANGLRERGHEVIMAVDIGMERKDDDAEHLPYAAKNDLVIVTFDRGFAGRTMSSVNHNGLICLAEKMRFDIGRQIRILSQFAETHSLEDTKGQVFWLK